MAGGRGTRLESPVEKPLFEIDGTPMVDRVLAALGASDVDHIAAAVSPNAPETRAHLTEHDRSPTLLETAGDGYVADLTSVLESDAASPSVSTPVLTVAADLPLLDGQVIDGVLQRYRRHARASGDGPDGENSDVDTGAPSLTVCVPVALKRRLGLGVETTLESTPSLAPTGVNVVGASDETMIARSYDHRLACNVNRRTDVRMARRYRLDERRDDEERSR